jgi:hypothetical protein
MGSNYDYREVAEEVIRRMGGKENVKHMLVFSKDYFLNCALPDAIGRCLKFQPSPDRDAVYTYIIELIRGEGLPDMRRILLDTKKQLEDAAEKIGHLLLYI